MANDANEVGYVHRKTGTVTYVPSAHSVEIASCEDDECAHVHLFLLDQVGQPIAECTLNADFVRRLIEWYQKKGSR